MCAKQSAIIANNDLVYLWWYVPKKIKNCKGFSIHRVVNGVEEPNGLYATVGFGVKTDKRKSPQTTDQWPIQSFNWKDLYAPRDQELRYKIYPMIGPWDDLNPDKSKAITTDKIQSTTQYGDAKVIFNRGILSTQAFAKSAKKNGGKMTSELARKLITEPTSEWRQRLGGQMLKGVADFFSRAEKEGGSYYAALYELTDEALIDELCRNKNTQVILSNANSSKQVNGKAVVVDDGTNKESRKRLHTEPNVKVFDRMLGTHIGHNKFVIYADKNGKPSAVLTGSTNWTSTGLCGQTNNMIILESDEVASQYKDYWDELKSDIPEKQGASFRKWCEDNSITGHFNGSSKISVWYSPNTKQKTKPQKNAARPVDMKAVFDLIDGAKETILYLVFNPGSPSIIDQVKAVAAARPKSKPPLFVRGAVSDAKIAAQVTTNIVAYDILKKPDTYYFDRVTGVAAIPGPFSYFEAELLKIGFATIHDKLIVIDPFGKNCKVVTGSHNLGYTASYKNDENLVIIEGDQAVAGAYATHVLDVVNHFKWRYKLQQKMKGAKTTKEKQKILSTTWNDLDETDKWMDYYFDHKGFIQRDKFIL